VDTAFRYFSDKAMSKLTGHLLTLSYPSPPRPLSLPNSLSQKTTDASTGGITPNKTGYIELDAIPADDLTYEKYVASKGYRYKGLGVGGTISRTRFEQLKATIVPFDARRFKNLVTSMEAAVVDFGDDVRSPRATLAEHC
jgi:hypothetical protein